MNVSEKALTVLKTLCNHYIVKNLLVFFLICFFVYISAFIVLRFYTNHGEALSTPDLHGMTVAEAEKLLQSNHLRCQLSDSVYLSSAKPGAIVSQNPEAGFKVKKNRNVFLTINALSPEKVIVPDVVGVTFRQAVSILESRGLTVGKLTYVPDIAQNNVLKQRYRGKEIKAGTKIVKGSGIDLELGL
jgi:beta-lactam-binding protein with PASTA domain